MSINTAFKQSLIAAALICVMAFTANMVRAADGPLPSWNDGKAKRSITESWRK